MPLRTSNWSCVAHEHTSGTVREPRILVAVSSEGVTYTVRCTPDAAPVVIHSDNPDTINFVMRLAAEVFDVALEDQPAQGH